MDADDPGLLHKIIQGFFGAGVKSSTKSVVFKKSVLKITVNGKEQTIDTSAGLNEELLNQLAVGLGLPISEVTKLLQENALQDVTSQATSQKVTGPLKQLTCPQCKHKVAQHAWCMYCGYEFGTAKETLTNEVDKKFLEQDVRPAGPAQEKQQQKLKDSYKERVKGIDSDDQQSSDKTNTG